MFVFTSVHLHSPLGLVPHISRTDSVMNDNGPVLIRDHPISHRILLDYSDIIKGPVFARPYSS